MAQDYTPMPFQAKTFVQTAEAALPQLDTWSQITEDEVDLVADMTRRNEISGGTPVVREFEERWRQWIGSQFSISTFNGTTAIWSAYFGIGVGPGDEVICPVNTWICSIASVPMMGGTPVFCEIDPETLMMDPADVEARITPRTVAILPVHLWGNVCNMDAILEIGRKHGIAVIEDVSHAHGAKYRGKMCGSMGIAGCWSLQGSKPISAGEGGVMVTDDVEVFERACLVGQCNRIQGIDMVRPKYAELQPLGLGIKFRSHPLGIGISNVQLSKIDELNRKRRAYVEEVEAGLVDVPGLRPLKVYEGAERAGFYGFPVIHEPEKMNGVTPEALVEALKTVGLKVGRGGYGNLHDLPLFQQGFDLFTKKRGPLCPESGWKGYRNGDFPNAELAKERTLFLPVLSEPIPNAAQMVLDAIARVVDGLMKG
jgi:perosamine synthetase